LYLNALMGENKMKLLEKYIARNILFDLNLILIKHSFLKNEDREHREDFFEQINKNELKFMNEEEIVFFCQVLNDGAKLMNEINPKSEVNCSFFIEQNGFLS